MDTRFSYLRCMEVINVSDGSRLGFISDLILDTDCGRLCAAVIPGPAKVMGLFGKTGDILIPWEGIRRIGEDIILVNAETPRDAPRLRRDARE